MADANKHDRLAQHIERVLHEAHLRYQRAALAHDKPLTPNGMLECAEVRGVRVQAPASQRNRVARSVFYYRLFCDHDVPRWEPCKSTLCNRTQADADRFLAQMIASRL